jgi:quercetin dioxygenase-like cupin family protein
MTVAKDKPETLIVQHEEPRRFEVSGSSIAGMAIPERGAQQIEVWHLVMSRGAASPLHWHDAEEVFIVTAGQGEVHSRGKKYEFTAPCTVICPARDMHQVVNAGGGKLELYAIVPVGSKIFLEDGEELKLPWRQ